MSDAAHLHQFRSAEEQKAAAYQGMWVFLVTEIMFFGGLFLTYLIYRLKFPAAFHAGSHALDVMLGGVNTAVLICSSLTMALAVRSAQTDKRKLLILFLILTMLFGSVFLGIKAVEYHQKFVHHEVPGAHFELEGASPEVARHAQIFFTLYFFMTGVHAFHMIIGLGLMMWLLVQSIRRRYGSHYYNPVEGVGLYWHFVDIVWIFLFPLLYLIGRH